MPRRRMLSGRPDASRGRRDVERARRAPAGWIAPSCSRPCTPRSTRLGHERAAADPASRTCTGPTSRRVSCSASCSPAASPRRSPIVTSYRSDDLHRRHPLRTAVAEWAPAARVSTRLQLRPARRRRRAHAGARAAPGAAARGRAAPHRRARRGQRVLHRGAGRRGRAGQPRRCPPTSPTCCSCASTSSTTPPGWSCAPPPSRVDGCSHELLAAVVDLDQLGLDAALRAAVESNVLVPVGADGYAFRHALLAEAVYDDLLPGERVRLHGAYVAALLAATSPAPPPSWPGMPGPRTTWPPRRGQASRPATRR